MEMHEQEWRELILTELRDLRKEFHAFKEDVISDMGERRGRTHIIAAAVSLLVSVVVAVIHSFSFPTK